MSYLILCTNDNKSIIMGLEDNMSTVVRLVIYKTSPWHESSTGTIGLNVLEEEI